MTTSDVVWRPSLSLIAVRTRKEVLFAVAAPGFGVAGSSLAMLVDDGGVPFANCFTPDEDVAACAATTSGDAIVTSTFDEPLKIVTNGKARSTRAGGSSRTRPSSLTWVKNA